MIGESYECVLPLEGAPDLLFSQHRGRGFSCSKPTRKKVKNLKIVITATLRAFTTFYLTDNAKEKTSRRRTGSLWCFLHLGVRGNGDANFALIYNVDANAKFVN